MLASVCLDCLSCLPRWLMVMHNRLGYLINTSTYRHRSATDNVFWPEYFSGPKNVINCLVVELEGLTPRCRGDPGCVGPEAYRVFGALFRKKNAKLATKVNMHLEWKKKPQQITNLKRLTNTTNITKFRKITIFVLLNYLTHFYNPFFSCTFLVAYFLIISQYNNDFVIFSTERTMREFSLPSRIVDQNLLFITDSFEKFLSASHLVNGNGK